MDLLIYVYSTLSTLQRAVLQTAPRDTNSKFGSLLKYLTQNHQDQPFWLLWLYENIVSPYSEHKRNELQTRILGKIDFLFELHFGYESED
jgi:hypothetical protein